MEHASNGSEVYLSTCYVKLCLFSAHLNKIFTDDHNLHLVNGDIFSRPFAIFAFRSSPHTTQRIQRLN